MSMVLGAELRAEEAMVGPSELPAISETTGTSGADETTEFHDVDKSKMETVEFDEETLNSSDDSEEGTSPNKQSENGKYEIAYTGEEPNAWTKSYFGIPANYFSVGVVYGGSVSILYPLLVIKEGVTTSFYTAAANLVTLFWSYKIFFGILSDCFPLFGFKSKPYVILGWLLCAAMLVFTASVGETVDAAKLVLCLSIANFGYVMADVAADGFMVTVAHRESISRRGRMQSLIYAVREVGRIAINILIIFGFSGPSVNCPGYESNPNVACTTDESVALRNDLYSENPNSWCHMKCDAAYFDFGLTISQYVWIIAIVNLVCIPTYFTLDEKKVEREKFTKLMGDFWQVLQRRAVWQVILYTMISSITAGVGNAAKSQTNYVWLNLTTTQNQLLNIFESIIFFVGLSLVRKYFLNTSWRLIMWTTSVMFPFFTLLYFLIVFDIWRNSWFYIFTDVTATFIATANFMASTFCVVEVAEPGFEAITYALITTANNCVNPLSSVISYQFLALFPELNTQESLATDTQSVRNSFALLTIITEIINLTSLLALPMLPRQKKECQELVAKGEKSKFWATFTIISGATFLIYSSVATFFTVMGAETYGCYKILGGGGCTEDESNVPVYLLVSVIFLYCYGVNFYHTFLPILMGKEKFSFKMFF